MDKFATMRVFKSHEVGLDMKNEDLQWSDVDFSQPYEESIIYNEVN